MSLDILPIECSQLIIGYLSMEDICRAQRVCTAWRSLFSSIAISTHVANRLHLDGTSFTWDDVLRIVEKQSISRLMDLPTHEKIASLSSKHFAQARQIEEQDMRDMICARLQIDNSESHKNTLSVLVMKKTTPAAIQVLIDHGAKMCNSPRDGFTTFELATGHPTSVEILQLLYENGAQIRGNPLRWARSLGIMKYLCELCEPKCYFHNAGEGGDSDFLYSLEDLTEEAFLFLIDRNLRPARNDFREDYIIKAIKLKRSNTVIQKLVDIGATSESSVQSCLIYFYGRYKEIRRQSDGETREETLRSFQEYAVAITHQLLESRLKLGDPYILDYATLMQFPETLHSRLMQAGALPLDQAPRNITYRGLKMDLYGHD